MTLVHVCDMSHSCVWHDFFICVTWLFCTWNMTQEYVCHNSYLWHDYMPHDRYSACRIHCVRDMTLSCVCQDSLIFVPWPICVLWHFSLKILHPQIHKPDRELKFLGTNSNLAQITIWICIARYQGIWVSRFLWISGVKHFSVESLSYVTKLRCMIWLRACLTTRTVTKRCVASM